MEQPAETTSPAEPHIVLLEGLWRRKRRIQKKLAAGRAGAAVRHKRLLEQLQAAKESLRPPVSAADNDSTSAPPKEAKPPKRTDERPEHNHNWIPWIIGACLARGSLAYVFAGFARGNMRLCASPASVAADPAPKVQDKPPQLKACLDPQYIWNKTMTTPAIDGKMLVNALYHIISRSGICPAWRDGDWGSPPEANLYAPRRWHGRGGRRSRHGD